MAKSKSKTKFFVLDTNVLLHDPSSLFRFEEHDIYLPMVTLEELDNTKKGLSEVARNARQTSRYLEEIMSSNLSNLEEGCLLNTVNNNHVSGRLFLQTHPIEFDLPMLAGSIADNQILSVVAYLKKEHQDRKVILVSKDINIRIKARTLGIDAEDYFNDKVMEDSELLFPGVRELPQDFWETHSKAMESWQEEGKMFYKITGPLCETFVNNEFVYYEFDKPFHAIVKQLNGKTATLQVVQDFTNPKFNVWGITARNREQNFALNVLLDPDIDFVTLLGQAGTGKTLLTLAAGLDQVLDKKIYSEIIMTRVTVSVGEDIGFLPGTEEEKMTPWMGALE
ncbi:MAG: PIN domain-containing protein, partial [Methylophilaceae bacterium]